MTEQLADLIQRRTLPNHVPCQTVPKQMGALACRVHSRPLECTHNQSGNCDRVGKPYPRSPAPNEHSSAGTRRATVAQVERKGFTYIDWQGQLSPAPTFRADGNPCLLPVDVSQVQCDDFASTQAQSGQQEQNRIIASSDGSPSVTAIQHSLYGAGGEELGQGRK